MDLILNENHPNVQRLIRDVKEKCDKLGVKLFLSPEKSVMLSENIFSGGYFSDETEGETPVLACAMGQTDFEKAILLFIHESCHLDQWSERKEKNSLWSKGDTMWIIDEWLTGEEKTESELDKAFSQSIEIEIDCEKRSVEKIKQYDIPVNIEQYIQKANAYILFYNYLRKHRKWSIPGNPPYGDLIYPHAPNYWLDDYTQIPKELEEAYDKYLGLI